MSSCASTEKFKVVILYEQRAFVGKAISTYFHLKRELGNVLESDLRIWRIDAVTLAEFAAAADRDIEAADVIIMAVRGGQPCPPVFHRWKTGAGLGLGVPHCAVIAITETADASTPAAATWNSVLRGSATQIHPEIYVWDPPAEFGEAEPEKARAGGRAPLFADATAFG